MGTSGLKEAARATAPVASSTLSVAVFTAPGKARLSPAIQEHQRYLEDLDRMQKTATSDQDLFDQMTALHPDWVANQSWLMFGFPGA